MCGPLYLRVFPSHSLCAAVMQSNTRVTLGPSERHPGGAAIFLIWPQNLLAYSWLLPLRQFMCSLTIVPWCGSCNREVLCAAATEVQTASEPKPRRPYSWPVDEDLCVLTCLWKVSYPRQCTASHGAAGLDTEELPGPAGETRGCEQGGTEWLCCGICGESKVMFLLLKYCRK